MPNRMSRSSEVMWSQLFLNCCEEGLNLQSRIRQMMVTAILDQQLPPCTSLTSCRKLAEQLGVARNTVVLAYQQLADEGFIIPRERSGYFVNPEILEGRIALEAPPPADKHPDPRLELSISLQTLEPTQYRKEPELAELLLPIHLWPVRRVPLSHRGLAGVLPERAGRHGNPRLGAGPNYAG